MLELSDLFWLIIWLPALIFIYSVAIMIRVEVSLRKFQYVPGQPIIENYHLLSNLKDLLKSLLKIKEEYGKTFKLNIFSGLSCIMTTDLKLIEYILGTTQILDKSISYNFLNRWLGTGLLTSPAEKWRKTRKILTPAFHFQILDHYIETFHSASTILVEKFQNLVNKGPVDIYPYVTLCTLDIICESAMGTKVHAQENSESEYVNAVRELCRIFMERNTKPIKTFLPTYIFTKDFQKELKALKILHGFTRSVIKSRKEELKQKGNDEGGKKRLAFLDLVLQAKIDGRDMSDEEIRQEVDTFMFEGHDTTASAISFILYCVSKHPDVQDKIIEELNDIFGKDKDSAAGMKQLNEMKYLERVIKESLRIYPSTPFFGRAPQKDTKYYGGFFAMYTQLVVFAYGVHHDPNIYPDPEKFDPDRFLPENISKRHPYSFLAFSAGPRNCIGQRFAMLEMKSTVSHVLRNFSLKPVHGYEPHCVPLAVMKSINGIRVQFEERNVLKNVMKFKQRYGDIFKINITIGMPALVISDLKILEFLLGTTQILEKSYTYSFLEKWLGHGLLTSPPEKWRKTRKILTPAFHFQILEQYVESFHSTTSILINKLKSSISKDPKTPIDIYPYITLCTLDIICETAMGTKINAQENTQSEYVKGVKELCRITVERTVNPMTMFPITYMFTKDYRIERHYLKILHNHTNSVIKRRREELIKNDHPKQKRLAFLDLLLQSTLDGKPMTDEEIREEVDTFMFAGHDTTASGISFILYCISKYADVQQKVCDEIEEILGNDKNFIPTIKQLNEMKYLEMVIKESLRLFPPVPIFARSPLNDTSHPSGLFPTWSQLLVFVYGVHRDPKNYDDPETFDPDRFLPENQSKRHPYSYLTFSAGPRNCIDILRVGYLKKNHGTREILEILLQKEEILWLMGAKKIRVIFKRFWGWWNIFNHVTSLLIIDYKLSGFNTLPGSMYDNYFKLTDLNNILKTLLEFKRKYGDTLRIRIAGFPAIITSDLKMLEYLLGTTQILDKAIMYIYLNKWLGNGLLTSKTDQWKKMRKIITPAFHFQILEHYIETFHSASSVLIENLNKHVKKGGFDVYPYITLCTLDIICESAMGTKVNAQTNSESSYVKAVREMCRIVIDRTLNPMKAFEFIYVFTKDYRKEKNALKILHGYTDTLIKSKKQELLANMGCNKNDLGSNRKRLAFLDLLLLSQIDGKPLTDEEIRQEVDTFMFAGHDTTASGISFILYCLSQHPHVQEKVFEEIQEIFKNDQTKQPGLKELNQMRYLEMVIKETLRLFPPVPFIGRCPSISDKKYYGGELPQYSQLVLFTYGVHRDPNIYEEPEKFDPERFSPDQLTKRHAYSYLAFSAGPRNCIGQKFAMLEMKSTVSHILRKFLIKPVQDFEPKLLPVTVLKSLNGIQIELEERKY
nr:uncharacterized protein LOC111427770 [Onthophagus taurus]